jgi:hypothetical protein
MSPASKNRVGGAVNSADMHEGSPEVLNQLNGHQSAVGHDESSEAVQLPHVTITGHAPCCKE